jgi:hypothetical protein
MSGIRKYLVKRDRFEYGETSIMSFPCCCCKHKSKSDTDQPCRCCDHNLNAAEDAAEINADKARDRAGLPSFSGRQDHSLEAQE